MSRLKGKDVSYIALTGDVKALFRRCSVRFNRRTVDLTAVQDEWEYLAEGAASAELTCEKLVDSSAGEVFLTLFDTGGCISICANLGGRDIAMQVIMTDAEITVDEGQVESATFRVAEGSVTVA